MALKLPNPLHSPSLRHRPQKSKSIVCCSSSNGSLKSHGTPGLRVAYQGAAGAYSEFAAKTACPGCTTVPCRSFSDAISAVDRGLADRAILPVESTMEGTAVRNYDLLLRHDDLAIVQEISLFVHYCLLAIPGVKKSSLRNVISHPMALAHCSRNLSLLGLHRVPSDDTAGAVQFLRSERLLDTAAIASPRAALIYGLDVVAHGIQDHNWNVTRFLLLSKSLTSSSAAASSLRSTIKKTSIVVAHRGGSMMVLLKVLSAFSSRNINLTKLEVNNPSVDGQQGQVMILDVRGPSLRSFPHVLYVDFEGSIEDDENVRDAIKEIEGFSVLVRVLGCYPADRNVYDLQ